MGTRPSKAAGNVYCRARLDAAKFNDRLNSREGASELLGCSPATLADYELGITKVVPVESVVRMADLYNAPELKNYYCTQECPIGKGCMHRLDVDNLDRLTLKVMSSLRTVSFIRDKLIDISADGIVSDDEVVEFKQVLTALDAISKNAQELKLWAEKMIGGRVDEN